MANLFKQTVIYAAVTLGLLLSACAKDLAEPDNGKGGDNGKEDLTDIPGDFDWGTTTTRQLTVKVIDEYEGKYYYTIEVYDENPINNSNAKILASGKTNKNLSFIREVVFPKTLTTLYLRQTDPLGYKYVTMLEVEEGDMVFDYSVARSPEQTKANPTYNTWGAPADYEELFVRGMEKATPIKNNGDKLKKNGVYKITEDYNGTVDFPDGKFTLYVAEGCKLRLNKNKEEYKLKDGAEIYILSGASLEANGGQDIEIKMDEKSGIFNAGTISIDEIEMGGDDNNVNTQCVIYNHPGGKIYLNSLSMNGSEIHNHCLIKVKDEVEFHGAGSKVLMNQNSSLLSDKVKIEENTSACEIDMLAKSLFETSELEREGYATLVVYGDPSSLNKSDYPLFKINESIECGNYNISFYRNLCFAAKKIEGKAQCFADQVEYDNLPVRLEGECYGKEYTPGENEPTDDSQTPDHSENSDKTASYTYMFEDNWPNLGDYDMNDLVMDVNIANTTKNGNATSVKLTTTLRAVGAAKDLYAYAEINVEGANKMVVPLFDGEAHALMLGGDNQTKQIINTYSYTCDPVTVTKTYSLPASVKGTVNAKNLNVFIVWGDLNKEVWNEIHLAGYPGTNKAATSSTSYQYKYKYDPMKENSDPSSENMMWALMMPTKDFKSYPKEGISIMDAYNGFKKWANSGGKEDMEWYMSPNESSLYKGN